MGCNESAFPTPVARAAAVYTVTRIDSAAIALLSRSVAHRQEGTAPLLVPDAPLPDFAPAAHGERVEHA